MVQSAARQYLHITESHEIFHYYSNSNQVSQTWNCKMGDYCSLSGPIQFRTGRKLFLWPITHLPSDFNWGYYCQGWLERFWDEPVRMLADRLWKMEFRKLLPIFIVDSWKGRYSFAELVTSGWCNTCLWCFKTFKSHK